jgi:hypothetical protein
MLCSTDREVSTTSEIVLTKGVRCSNVRPFTKTIRTSGRQNDFNYWFDCRLINEADKRPTVQLAFAPDAYGRDPTGSYVITIICSFRFRYPQSIVPPTLKASGGNGIRTLEEKKEIDNEVDKKESEKEETKEEEKKEEKKEKDVWEMSGEDDDLEYENEVLRNKIKKLENMLKNMKINGEEQKIP